MSYQLGIDLGATVTDAAVCRSGRTEAALRRPSVLSVASDGSVTVGEDAARGAPVRQFTHRVGDGTPMLVGAVALTADTLTARFVARVVAEVSAWAGGAPTRVALTHPPAWGPHRLTALRTALTAEGLGEVLFVSSAHAAALAMTDPVPVGQLVAVYDLGGTGLDATVLRRLPDGGYGPAGRPEELEVGGLDLDELVFDHVRAALGSAWDGLDPTDPAVLAGLGTLRRECTLAKESLSADTDVEIPVVLPGIDTRVRLARPEFEELIRPVIEETAATLQRAIAGAPPAAVLLTGGSARIPLITQVVSAQLGRPVTVAEDPQGGIASGAAIAAGRLDAPPPVPTRVVLRAAPAPNLATPVRPPIPVVAPPAEQKTSRVPRILAAAALMAVLAGGGIALANRTGPSDADADPVSTTTSPTLPPEIVTPLPTTTEPAPAPRTTERPEPRETTDEAPTTTSETTTVPPSSSETTTTETATETTTWPSPSERSVPESEEVRS
jgi:molecular chaperone DnaK (HSP70)